MLRLIIFVQAIIYLFIMPAIHDYMDLGYRAPLFFSIIAIIFLIAGFATYKLTNRASGAIHGAPNSASLISRSAAVPLGIALLSILYVYVSWTNGLWNRRQGSEVMADLYGNLPLVQLAILRVYEILFIPIAVIYTFGNNSWMARFFVLSFLMVSLPFMGIQDSRGRLLVVCLCLLSCVKIENFRSLMLKNAKLGLLMLLAIGTFFYVSAQRLSGYSTVNEYMFGEVVTRMDGLNLVSELRDYGYITYLGSFDFAMFYPLVSRIPFIDAGRIAKIEGVTSTKQYFLKSVINSGRIDDSNSIILDPLYLGGLLGLATAFLFLGYLIAGFDRYIAEERLFSSHLRLALMLAFITSFVTIEVDFFGAFTSFIQNFVILFPALTIMLYKPIASHNLATSINRVF